MQPTSDTPDPPKRRRGRPVGSRDQKPRKSTKRASPSRPAPPRNNSRGDVAANNSADKSARIKKAEPTRACPIEALKRQLGVEPSGKSPSAMRRKRRLLFGVLQAGFSLTRACKASGIDLGSVRRWRKKHKLFDVAIRAAEDQGVDVLVDGLHEQALGLRSSSGFLATVASLKARRPTVWRENLKIETDAKLTIAPGEGFRAQLDALGAAVREAAAQHMQRLANEREMQALPDRKLIDVTPVGIGPEPPPKPTVVAEPPIPPTKGEASAAVHLAPPIDPERNPTFDAQADERRTTGDRDHRYSRGERGHG